MKISLVTPVRNDTRVAAALDSILSQQVDADVELIVVDGASTDGTLDILHKYDASISKLVSEPDAGIYDAMNKGIAAATGDVVGILNADDRYVDTHALEHVRRAFLDPAVDAAYGDALLVGEDGRAVRYWRAGAPARAKWWLGWMPPHPTFFVRRHLYNRHGRFRTDLRIAADYEMMLRLAVRHHARLAYVPRLLVRFSLGGHSNRSIRAVVQNNLESRRAWKLNGLPMGHLVPVLKPGRKVYQYALAALWNARNPVARGPP